LPRRRGSSTIRDVVVSNFRTLIDGTEGRDGGIEPGCQDDRNMVRVCRNARGVRACPRREPRRTARTGHTRLVL
jgi:hypothetical protein